MGERIYLFSERVCFRKGVNIMTTHNDGNHPSPLVCVGAEAILSVGRSKVEKVQQEVFHFHALVRSFIHFSSLLFSSVALLPL